MTDDHSSLHEKTLAYLREHNVMTLATSGPQGLWAAAVFYVNGEVLGGGLVSHTDRAASLKMRVRASEAIPAL